MKILLDMGHCLSGADTGAIGNGRKEQDCTREIGYKVKSKLEALGHVVVVVSPDNANTVGESLAYRVNKANKEGGDIYISIHLNAGGGHGTEVFTYGAKQLEEAQRVISEFVALGYINRGIKDGSKLYVVKNTKMKAMLIECCFIDTDDMQRYDSEAFANAIVKGITGQATVTIPVQQPQPIVPKVNAYDFKSLQGFIGAVQDNITSPITLSKCPLIKIGAKGSIVNWVQARLNYLGFNCGVVDGIFGNVTLTAVKAFQSKHGLTADGIVGQNTWKKLLGL